MDTRTTFTVIGWAVAGFAALLIVAGCGDEPVQPDPRIVAYASERMDSAHTRLITHLNYSFANVVDGQVVLGRPEQDSSLKVLQRLKQFNPDLKLLISVGGWSWSEGFSDAALTDSSRHRFAQSAVDFVTTYELDGVDLDWEYPGQRGEDNVFRPEDKQNFTLLLAEVRRMLDDQARREGRPAHDPYLLTIATGANQRYLDHTEMDRAHAYLDFVNIMTYDFHTGGSTIAGHHTNLSPSAEVGSDGRNARQAVEEHLAAGVPADKLVLGVAFYGRSWSGVDADAPAAYGPFTGEHRALAYHTLSAQYVDKGGFSRYWDEAAEAPYLWNDSLKTLISYDDVESLARKATFVKEKGLGGVMFWHYRHDTTGVLLQTLNEALDRDV